MKMKKYSVTCFLNFFVFFYGVIVHLEAKVTENAATMYNDGAFKDNSTIFKDEIVSVSTETPVADNEGYNDDEMVFNGDVATTMQELKKYSKRYTAIRGRLKVKVRYAQNLQDTDGWWNLPDPYVKVRAVRSTLSSYSRDTSCIQGTRNPTWDEWLDMGCSTFVGYTVQVFDEDPGFDDHLSNLEFKHISAGYHIGITHCTLPDPCGGSLRLDYNFVSDGTECSPYKCLNGGICREGCSSYSCSCSSSYTGDRCQYRQGSLTIYARYGRGLQDRDGWGAGDSDPYMRVTAYDHSGNSRTLSTHTDRGDNSPEWHEYLHFGTDTWRRFQVSIRDEDSGSDDHLSGYSTWNLPSTSSSSRSYVRMSCYSGYVEFDYTFT